MPTRSATQCARSEQCQLWAPIASITAGVAEVLAYNELTMVDPDRPAETRRLVPQCFYAQGNQIKFVCFEGGDRRRVDLFRRAGIFHCLRNSAWKNNLSLYTIRRIGDDPWVWVHQTLEAYVSFSRSLFYNASPPDPCQLEADVLDYAQELIQEVIDLQMDNIVHLHDKTFPSMLHRINRLYDVNIDSYATTGVLCTPNKPCLLVTCFECTTDEKRLWVRRHAARGFICPPYTVPCCPESVKEIWRRPVVGKSWKGYY
jgi:hypothetical protein